MAGFAEGTEPFATPPQPQAAQAKVAQDGRILIPAELRRAAGLEPGVAVSVIVEDGEVRISTWPNRVRQIQEAFAPLRRPGVSIVDELIADRRAEAAREAAEFYDQPPE